jgi:hypothetical protein
MDRVKSVEVTTRDVNEFAGWIVGALARPPSDRGGLDVGEVTGNMRHLGSRSGSDSYELSASFVYSAKAPKKVRAYIDPKPSMHEQSDGQLDEAELIGDFLEGIGQVVMSNALYLTSRVNGRVLLVENRNRPRLEEARNNPQ